jgi:hypothetical protein
MSPELRFLILRGPPPGTGRTSRAVASGLFPYWLLQAPTIHHKRYHMFECQGCHHLRRRRFELVFNLGGGERATSIYDWSVAVQIRNVPQAGPCPVARLLAWGGLRLTVPKKSIGIEQHACSPLIWGFLT